MSKLVVLGGSSVATPELILALAQVRDVSFDIILHGRDENKLADVGRVCAQLAEGSPEMRVGWTTDLARAVDGADFVLNQIRVGGLEARAFDESFPHQFDIPGEETIGPGGFANALRTIPVCLAYAREIERRAPESWFVNLTNPAGMVQAALTLATKLRVVSVCDSPVTLIEHAARLVEAVPGELETEYVGMLHLGWIVGIVRDGIDLMPRALENMSALPGLAADPRLVQAIGAIPSPYLNYFLAPDVMLARQRAKGHTRAHELQELEAQLLTAYAGGDQEAVKQRAAVWYEKIIVPVLLALLRGGREIVNARNGAAIPWLPPDTIVELRAQIDARGIRPLSAAPAPRDVQAMLQTNAAYEALAVEAALNDSYTTAWRALRLHPLVKSSAQARAILDLVWKPRGVPLP